MAIRNTLITLYRDLRSHRLRAVLTTAGIAWGTVAAVLLMALGTGLRRNTLEQQHGLGDGIVIVWPTLTTRAYAGFAKGRPVRLEADDVLRLPDEVPELEAVCPEYTGNVRIRNQDATQVVLMTGVYPAYRDLRHTFPQAGGRFINDFDIAQRRRVVFLGDRIKQRLFEDRPAVGASVFINNVRFDVIGVLRPKQQNSSYMGRDSSLVCIPATTFASMFGRQYITDFVYRASDPREQPVVGAKINDVLGRQHQFDPEDPEALSRWDTTESNRFFFYFFLALDILLGGSGVFTLLVGGISVANIMYIIVHERTHEIGIQLALGARPRRVLVHFLGQALILTAVGGILGFAISTAITAVVAQLPVTEHIGTPQVSIPVAAGTTVLLGVVGVVAGYFPARQAARMDPVEALGY